MKQKFMDYIKKLDILYENLDIDFSDYSFAYDYNEVQELYFDIEKNNYVFLAGETGLRKKDMLARICKDLILRGTENEDILYLDYELPILHGCDVISLIDEFYNSRNDSKEVHIVINEVQEIGDWYSLVEKLQLDYPKTKFICSSSTPSYIFEKLYDVRSESCKIVVLSKKNVSNIKYQSTSFGVYEEFKYNQKGNIIEIKGLTKEGKKMEHHIVPSTINGLPVTVIASGAFHDRKEMLTIKLPESIEMIGDYAFSKCCNLKTIKLPKKLKYIGEHSFLGAKSLENIFGGDDVEHIGNSAFYDTKWLDKQEEFAVIGKTLYKYVGKKIDVIIPHSIEVLASYSFAESKIHSISIPDKTSINEGTFYKCDDLEIFNYNLENIPAFAFYKCRNLKKDFDVTSIDKFGLYGCEKTKQIKAETLGKCSLSFSCKLESVINSKLIDDGALYGCSELKNLDCCALNNLGKFALSKTNIDKFISNAERIDDFCFYDCYALRNIDIHSCGFIGKAIFLESNNVENLIISGSYKLSSYFGNIIPRVSKLTVYGDIVDDFSRNNPYLEELTLNDVANFGRWSFYNNSKLSSILMSNVYKIGAWAFAYCDCITEVNLPNTIAYLEMNAFRYCHNLSKIVINSQQYISFGPNAFYSTSEDKRFYINKSFKCSYENASIWHEYLYLIEYVGENNNGNM